MRLLRPFLEASNQNRYCSWHNSLSPEPLSTLLCFLFWPLGGAKVPKVTPWYQKTRYKTAEANLEASNQNRYCSWHNNPLVAKLTNIEWCSKVLGIGNYVRNNICFGCKPLKWPQSASCLVFWYRCVTLGTLAPPSDETKYDRRVLKGSGDRKLCQEQYLFWLLA